LAGRDGQVGFELAKLLQGELIATDRATLDLSRQADIRKFVREARPGLIVNATAYNAVDRAESEPERAMQINGTAPGPIPGTFTSVNLPGESTREGVEVSARVKLDRNLTLGGAYTYTDARTPTGEREFRRPLHGGRADLAYAFNGGRGTATFAAIYNGRQDDLAFTMPFFFPTQRVTLDAYWLLNATAAYKLQPGVEVFGRVENALDQHYQEVFGFESPPLAAYAGLKLTFGGTEGFGTAWAK
jgi:outer membrane receptor protein involved in Fe transport